MFVNTCNKNKQLQIQEQNIAALTDTIEVRRNKQGEEQATIKVLTFENRKQALTILDNEQKFSLLRGKIKRLRSQSNDATIVVIESETKVSDTVTNIQAIYTEKDTLYKVEINKYQDWITGQFTIGKDTANYDISIKNDYVGSLYYKRDKGFKNLFKPKYPIFELTNKNPYTYTKDMQVAQIKSEKFNTRFCVATGLGVGLTSELKIQPMLGLFVGYKLIDL
jgi:hypothetical protein